MPSYLDSSVLLGWLLGQPGSVLLDGIWEGQDDRVSSVLLEAECVTVLRRVAALQPAREQKRFLSSRLEALDRCLDGIHLQNVDSAVMACLRNEPRLSECRSLDALHLATALLFQENSERPVKIATQDEKMKALARRLGFEIIELPA